MTTVTVRSIPFGRPLLGDEEKRAVVEIISNPILVHGPRAEQFERDFATFCQAPYAVAVANCTAAMHLVWFARELAPGDEVIVPAQTHVATAHAVELAGGRPVFVDSERATGNMDLSLLEAAITDRTRAIAVVHYLGYPLNMAPIAGLAKKHGLFVLEDCALAVGTYCDHVHAGLLGDVGCFSFYPVKHMTTGEGGMVITRDENLAAKVRHQRAFGLDRNFRERTVPGVYDVAKLGFNYRMNEIAAGLGIEQLKRVPGFLARRRENFRALRQGLAQIDEIEVMPGIDDKPPNWVNSCYCLSAVLKPQFVHKRLQIVDELKAAGIGTSVYYPRPVPFMSYYRDRYGYAEGAFPVADWISRGSISLPVGPHVMPDDMVYIVDHLKRAVRRVLS
jgi:dTDP-4-amino-4,6-dideoxygalactose transaminase